MAICKEIFSRKHSHDECSKALHSEKFLFPLCLRKWAYLIWTSNPYEQCMGSEDLIFFWWIFKFLFVYPQASICAVFGTGAKSKHKILFWIIRHLYKVNLLSLRWIHNVCGSSHKSQCGAQHRNWGKLVIQSWPDWVHCKTNGRKDGQDEKVGRTGVEGFLLNNVTATLKILTILEQFRIHVFLTAALTCTIFCDKHEAGNRFDAIYHTKIYLKMFSYLKFSVSV